MSQSLYNSRSKKLDKMKKIMIENQNALKMEASIEKSLKRSQTATILKGLNQDVKFELTKTVTDVANARTIIGESSKSLIDVFNKAPSEEKRALIKHLVKQNTYLEMIQEIQNDLTNSQCRDKANQVTKILEDNDCPNICLSSSPFEVPFSSSSYVINMHHNLRDKQFTMKEIATHLYNTNKMTGDEAMVVIKENQAVSALEQGYIHVFGKKVETDKITINDGILYELLYQMIVDNAEIIKTDYIVDGEIHISSLMDDMTMQTYEIENLITKIGNILMNDYWNKEASVATESKKSLNVTSNFLEITWVGRKFAVQNPIEHMTLQIHDDGIREVIMDYFPIEKQWTIHRQIHFVENPNTCVHYYPTAVCQTQNHYSGRTDLLVMNGLEQLTKSHKSQLVYEISRKVFKLNTSVKRKLVEEVVKKTNNISLHDEIYKIINKVILPNNIYKPQTEFNIVMFGRINGNRIDLYLKLTFLEKYCLDVKGTEIRLHNLVIHCPNEYKTKKSHGSLLTPIYYGDCTRLEERMLLLGGAAVGLVKNEVVMPESIELVSFDYNSADLSVYNGKELTKYIADVAFRSGSTIYKLMKDMSTDQKFNLLFFLDSGIYRHTANQTFIELYHAVTSIVGRSDWSWKNSEKHTTASSKQKWNLDSMCEVHKSNMEATCLKCLWFVHNNKYEISDHKEQSKDVQKSELQFSIRLLEFGSGLHQCVVCHENYHDKKIASLCRFKICYDKNVTITKATDKDDSKDENKNSTHVDAISKNDIKSEIDVEIKVPEKIKENGGDMNKDRVNEEWNEVKSKSSNKNRNKNKPKQINVPQIAGEQKKENIKSQTDEKTDVRNQTIKRMESIVEKDEAESLDASVSIDGETLTNGDTSDGSITKSQVKADDIMTIDILNQMDPLKIILTLNSSSLPLEERTKNIECLTAIYVMKYENKKKRDELTELVISMLTILDYDVVENHYDKFFTVIHLMLINLTHYEFRSKSKLTRLNIERMKKIMDRVTPMFLDQTQFITGIQEATSLIDSAMVMFKHVTDNMLKFSTPGKISITKDDGKKKVSYNNRVIFNIKQSSEIYQKLSIDDLITQIGQLDVLYELGKDTDSFMERLQLKCEILTLIQEYVWRSENDYLINMLLDVFVKKYLN